MVPGWLLLLLSHVEPELSAYLKLLVYKLLLGTLYSTQ